MAGSRFTGQKSVFICSRSRILCTLLKTWFGLILTSIILNLLETTIFLYRIISHILSFGEIGTGKDIRFISSICCKTAGNLLQLLKRATPAITILW